MTREEFVKSQEYVFGKMQLGLLNMLNDYMVAKDIKPTNLAEELGVTKGYISQLLNVTYDHKLSKVANLALSCNKMPILKFVDLDEFVNNDALDLVYELTTKSRFKTNAINIPMANVNTDGRTGLVVDIYNSGSGYKFQLEKENDKMYSNNLSPIQNIG
jgi:hypothetical protein